MVNLVKAPRVVKVVGGWELRDAIVRVHVRACFWVTDVQAGARAIRHSHQSAPVFHVALLLHPVGHAEVEILGQQALACEVLAVGEHLTQSRIPPSAALGPQRGVRSKE